MSNEEKQEQKPEEPTGDTTGEASGASTGDTSGENSYGDTKEAAPDATENATGDAKESAEEAATAANSGDAAEPATESTDTANTDTSEESKDSATDTGTEASAEESKSEDTSTDSTDEPSEGSTEESVSSGDSGGGGGNKTTTKKESSGDAKPEREGRMTFLEHLLELRSRLVSAMIGVIIMTVVTLAGYQYIFAFMRAPMDKVNQEWMGSEELRDLAKKKGFDPNENILEPITTNPLGLMLVLMKVSIYSGLLLASPWLIYQIWAFVSPGLTKKEAGAIRPVLLGGIFAFIAGAAFCYYVVFPITLGFVVWFDITLGFKPSYTPTEYFGLLITFMLIFGAVFEIPLVSAVFARLGLLKPVWLTVFWRYVVVGCFIAGALFSPGGEPISMIIMSLSLLVLYAMSIVLAKICYAKRQKAIAEDADSKA